MKIFTLICVLFLMGCSEPNASYNVWKGAHGIQRIEISLGETLTQVRMIDDEEKQKFIKKIGQAITVIDNYYEQLSLNEGIVPDPAYAYKISRENKNSKSAILVNLSVTFEIKNKQEADYLRPYLANLKKDLEEVNFDER